MAKTIVINHNTGERNEFPNANKAADFLGINVGTVYQRFYKNYIKDGIEIQMEGNVKVYHERGCTKSISGKDYKLEEFNNHSAVFSSYRLMVDGDTEDSLKSEISANLTQKIKKDERVDNRFIFTCNVFDGKFFYEIVFLFKEPLKLKEKQEIILELLH